MNNYIFAKKLGMTQIFDNNGIRIPITLVAINSKNLKDLQSFKIGEYLKISGSSIGKGNLGNIKRHHFKRGPMSHGSKHHKLQGSLGAGTTPSRVFPGKKMAGRTGGNRITIFKVFIIDIFI